MSNFFDGLKNVYQSIVNTRSATANNRTEHIALDYTTMTDMYKSGLGSKVIRLKAGAALSDTIQFVSEEDEDFYRKKLEQHVKDAAKFMMAFGRGVIFVHNKGDDISKPLIEINPDKLIVRSFSGDIVTAMDVDRDLESSRYMKPKIYNVYGKVIHHSRIIDFVYVRPVELDLPYYRYGGISEFELIYEQFIADSIIQRACPVALERSSNWVYKLEGFAAAIQSKQSTEIATTMAIIENARSMYGAAVIDKNDEVLSLSSSLQNLGEIDQIGLRRLAMVTGIPLSVLIGESVRGLNSTGENEMTSYLNMVSDFQQDYLLKPINDLMVKCDQGSIEFSENSGQSPEKSAAYEKTIIENAAIMTGMGLDGAKYLESKGIVEPVNFDSFFEGGDDEA